MFTAPRRTLRVPRKKAHDASEALFVAAHAADRASEALRNAISGQTRRWHESGGKCWTDLNHDTWVFIASKLDGVEGLLSLSHVS